MTVRGAVSAALASAGILLAGWQAGAQVAEVQAPVAAMSVGATGGAAAGDGTSGTGSTDSGSSESSTAAGGTYTGASVQTRFGSVQVQITVKAGAITDVKALHLTDDDRKSVQISNRAAPLLRSEALAAQSANVQTISGATVTSDAYLTSLQAAIDAAHL
ncbi:uncharacterized protein with FMN-binding domain [Arthrobacter pascens]|uniref:FMN-binding protein n=1 Tax=Arthrobacter pascens TaxID=1677 RepID=UPI00277EAC1E|nr:FMN-binding protein [Arthrobacter pascens]MDQ0636350.1 uncharacterized protein with FMN-binding domain [Arthrobacter pascens]